MIHGKSGRSKTVFEEALMAQNNYQSCMIEISRRPATGIPENKRNFYPMPEGCTARKDAG
jgi:hypothetical protein